MLNIVRDRRVTGFRLAWNAWRVYVSRIQQAYPNIQKNEPEPHLAAKIRYGSIPAGRRADGMKIALFVLRGGERRQGG
jgi:hypothetical protein